MNVGSVKNSVETIEKGRRSLLLVRPGSREKVRIRESSQIWPRIVFAVLQ